jgi:regulator of protease activity HflC (stomatin/prohibitin superfamily)
MSLLRFNLLMTALLLLMLLLQSLVLVHDGEHGLLLRDSEIVNADLPTGVYLDVPHWHEVQRIDARLRLSDAGRVAYATSEGDELLAEAFVAWQVRDARQFFLVTEGDAGKADLLLMPHVQEGLRRLYAAQPFARAVAGLDPESLAALTAELDQCAQRELGVSVRDVRVRQTDYLSDVREVVYQRMRSDYDSTAARYQAESTERLATIAADAERERARIAADAADEVAKRRLAANAEVAAVTRDAQEAAPEFYRFWKSTQVLLQNPGKPGDVLVLQAGSELLPYVKSPSSKPPQPSP